MQTLSLQDWSSYKQSGILYLWLMPTSFNLAAVCTAGSLLQNLCLEAQDESVSQTQQHKTVPRAVQGLPETSKQISMCKINGEPCKLLL